MYEKPKLNNRAAFFWATTGVVGATACQVYFGAAQLSLMVGGVGLVGASVSANKRALTFAAATTAMTTIGIIGGDWINDRSRTNERLLQQENVLVLPSKAMQKNNIYNYTAS